MTSPSTNPTALLVAALRAVATAHADPVCNDPWAAKLAGDEGQEMASRCLQATPHMDLWVGVRTAFFDAHVQTWANAGRPQVVLLGAGLDTRAGRFAKLPVRFFEVDSPEHLEDKEARIAQLGDYPLGAATYVPCALGEGSVMDALVEAGFKTDTPALFIWEGAARSISQEHVRAVFSDIADRCTQETLVLFDILGRKSDNAPPSLAEPSEGDLRVGAHDILPMLYEEGYRYVRSTSFDEACLMLTGTYDRERMFHLQHVILAGLIPPSIP